MKWVEDAFEELGLSLPRVEIKYSGRFKPYNANVKYTRATMTFGLASQWQEVDEEIQKGVIQHLLTKVHNLPRQTLAIKLYDQFLKQLSTHSVADNVDPYLKERFDIINEEYFANQMSLPNLEWGQASTRQLGRYHYASDTVRMSTILKENQDLLDYVLYHELLHKKHKYSSSKKRTLHHSKAFRADEAKFKLPDAEKKLHAFVRKFRKSSRFSWFSKKSVY